MGGGCINAVEFAKQGPIGLKVRVVLFNRLLGEDHYLGAVLGRFQGRIGRHRHLGRAALEGSRGLGPNRRPWLLVVFAVALDDAGLQGVENHGHGFVEALSRGVHIYAELVILPARQAAAHPKNHPTVRQLVQQRDLLGRTQRRVPRHDHRAGRQLEPCGDGCEMAQVDGIIGTKGVVLKVVFHRPVGVIAEFL